MSTPNLPDILARLAAATPGPWCFENGYVLAGHPDAIVAIVDHPRDAPLLTHAPTDLAALATEVATLRATLADPRVARVIAEIRLAEDAAVIRIGSHRLRDRLIARLAALADGERHEPDLPHIDRLLYRLGVAGGTHPELIHKVDNPAIHATPSTARVLARLLTSAP